MWKTVKISDVCEFQSGLWKGKKGPFVNANVIRNTNFKPDGKLSYENIAFLEVEVKELSKRQLIDGDIILEKSGGGEKTPVGRVCLFKNKESEIPYSLSNFTCLIRVKQHSILYYRYLHIFLHYMYAAGKTEPMQRNSTGIRNLQLKEYKEICIPLPPIEEQKDIVTKLDARFKEIDSKINLNLKKLIYIEKLKKSVLNKIFGKDLIKLNEASTLIKRGISPKYTETGGIVVINQRCVRNHIINFSNARRHNVDLKKVPNERIVEKGDVLINSTGQGTLGRVAQVLEKPAEKTTVDSHVTIVRPKKELFDFGFFGKALIKIEDELKKAGEGTSGQTELSRSKLESNFFIPYLRSIQDQKEVSFKLDKIFENTSVSANLINKTIQSLKALKLSLLNYELNKTG
tara:strand:+ start:2325 stop:3530 length:1206 start_codon:yes stop_codon:yes gene_type:complete